MENIVTPALLFFIHEDRQGEYFVLPGDEDDRWGVVVDDDEDSCGAVGSLALDVVDTDVGDDDKDVDKFSSIVIRDIMVVLLDLCQ